MTSLLKSASILPTLNATVPGTFTPTVLNALRAVGTGRCGRAATIAGLHAQLQGAVRWPVALHLPRADGRLAARNDRPGPSAGPDQTEPVRLSTKLSTPGRCHTTAARHTQER